MAKKVVVYTPTASKNDIYQGSNSTNYVRDQTTGQLQLLSGSNTRTIIAEMFPSAKLMITSNYTNGSNTLYTVPDGKILLLTGISMQVTFKAGTIGNSGLVKVAGNDLMNLFGNDTAGTSALNFPLNAIIILTSGQKVEISGSANIKCMAGLMGYELESSQIKLS